MIKRDVTGRVSRLYTIGQVLFLAQATQSILSVSGLPIPPEYQWIKDAILAFLGVAIMQLRLDTKTPMQ